MSSCCAPDSDRSSGTGQLTVALAGNPNSGKTTVFNALTGLRQKVGNYPGVTVEKKTGRCKLPGGRWADIIDLPGTYSLISRSPDELVAMEVLRGLREGVRPPDVVVVVVDASNLQRNLYLVSQLIELGPPLVVALNMMDVAERRGIKVSPQALQRELGVPVIPVVGHKKRGIPELKAAITQARVAPMPDWPVPDAIKEELMLVGGALGIIDSQEGIPDGIGGLGFKEPGVGSASRTNPVMKGQEDGPQCGPCKNADRETDRIRFDRYLAIAERLLVGDKARDLDRLAGREPVAKLLAHAHERLAQLGLDPMQADIEAHYQWIEGVAHRVTAATDSDSSLLTAPTLTDRIDSIFIHRVWGFMVFAIIMASLFVTIFWLADPIMAVIRHGVEHLGHWIATLLPDNGPLRDLVADGIFAGVGAVVVFVPQIALLFLFLAILEDSGYLARAAFIMDRVLARVGLHGKSFIPLLSSFACAIPGIMATRTVENRKDRLATILVAPFMSCSARLPVYTLLIGTFFATRGAMLQAGIMLALYALGILAAFTTAWCVKRTVLHGPSPAFILEMPSYKFPQASQVGRQVWVNTWEFLSRAGTTIFCLSIILWAMTYYPRLPDSRVGQYRDEKTLASARLDHSIAGRLGHVMEPVFRPLGFDWKMDVGLVGAFAAREVFVSTIGIIYSVGEDGGTADLSKAMQADTHPDGRPVWNIPVALALLVWFVLAMQCMSTLAVVRRETGGWKWPVFMLAYMNTIAYIACFVVYQIGSRIWST